MISFARAMLATVLASSPVAAREPAAPVPSGLAASVSAAVAALWATDAPAIRLEWGAIPSAVALSDTTPFRLTGKGAGGWLVALFRPAGRSAVAVRVRAGVVDSVMLAARPLAAGVTLEEADLRPATAVRWGPPRGETRPGAGWITRRAVFTGDELGPSTVMAPQLVHAGDQVRVVWRQGPVTVALDGVALSSAALGETVSVRLAQRGGQRRGTVSGPGSVRLES